MPKRIKENQEAKNLKQKIVLAVVSSESSAGDSDAAADFRQSPERLCRDQKRR